MCYVLCMYYCVICYVVCVLFYVLYVCDVVCVMSYAYWIVGGTTGIEWWVLHDGYWIVGVVRRVLDSGC
jgi:hypothetical protein